MTPDELALTWVPVPLRMRHVIAGDVFVSRVDGTLWHVNKSKVTTVGGWGLVVDQGDLVLSDHGDPDDTVDVLVPVLERDAVELTIEELGARLVSRWNEE